MYANLLKKNGGSLDGIRVDWLLHEGKVLTARQRRELLRSVTRPNLPNLLDHVADDLNSEDSSGFGEFAIHLQLLPEQLDELARRHPDLKNVPRFVETRIGKMRPPRDTGQIGKDEALREFLAGAWAYLDAMPHVHASLKFHVLHHLLAAQRRAGIHDRGLFDAYIAIPRDRPYVAKGYLAGVRQLNRTEAQTDFDAAGATGLPSIGDDEALLRAYLLHFIGGGDAWKPFTRYLAADWVKPLAAEAGLVNGRGDPERWASMLDPSAFSSLRDRVDLELEPENPRAFEAGEAVELKVLLKNVPRLLVKVYEINALNYCRDFGENAGLDIALEGLLPSEERVHEYNQIPLQQHDETFRISRT